MCNQCHSIFCIYEGSYNFLNDGLDAYNHYMNTISKNKSLKFILQLKCK